MSSVTCCFTLYSNTRKIENRSKNQNEGISQLHKTLVIYLLKKSRYCGWITITFLISESKYQRLKCICPYHGWLFCLIVIRWSYGITPATKFAYFGFVVVRFEQCFNQKCVLAFSTSLGRSKLAMILPCWYESLLVCLCKTVQSVSH